MRGASSLSLPLPFCAPTCFSQRRSQFYETDGDLLEDVYSVDTGLADKAPPKEIARFSRAMRILGLAPHNQDMENVRGGHKSSRNESIEGKDDESAARKSSGPKHLMLVKLSGRPLG